MKSAAKAQKPQSIVFQTQDVIVWRRGRRYTEVAAVPAFELATGGCWVILSFTHELVRVSRSGGTVSMSENTHRKTLQSRGVKRRRLFPVSVTAYFQEAVKMMYSFQN